MEMKYSYIPTKQYLSKISFPNGWFGFDSEERFCAFRDQFGENFIFAPRKVVMVSMYLAIALGIIIGRFVI